MGNIAFVLLGAAAGIVGGVVGVGGGIIMVPALVIIFGFSQHMAQGTTLAAMIPPVGILAALTYIKRGHVYPVASAFIAVGLFFGGWLGGTLASHVSREALQKVFGVLLLIVGVRFVFFMGK